MSKKTELLNRILKVQEELVAIQIEINHGMFVTTTRRDKARQQNITLESKINHAYSDCIASLDCSSLKHAINYLSEQ